MRVEIKGRAVGRLVEDGVVVDVRETTNFLTEVGEAYLADRLSDRDEADGDISHMAIGEGTGQDRTSTTLATEVARVALTVGYPDQLTGVEDNVVQWKADFPAGTPATDKTITEAALFSSTPTGTMVNYLVFDPPLDKKSTQNLLIDVYWTIGAS